MAFSQRSSLASSPRSSPKSLTASPSTRFMSVADMLNISRGMKRKVPNEKRKDRKKNLVLKTNLVKSMAKRLSNIEHVMHKLERKYLRRDKGPFRVRTASVDENEKRLDGKPVFDELDSPRHDSYMRASIIIKRRNELAEPEDGAATSVLLPDSHFRFAHDIIALLVTLGDIFFPGYIIAVRLPDTEPGMFEVIYFIFSTFCHLIFVYLSFRTAYLQGWELIGDEADEVSHVARNYLHGWFKIDVLTLIPIDVIILPLSVTGFNVMCILRFTRATKVHRLFQLSDPLKEKSPRVTLTQFMFLWIVSVHFLSCIWIFLGGDPDKEKYNETRQYVRALYFIITTMTTVGYGDIVPDSISGTIFTCVVMVVGAGMYASALSALGAVLSSMDLLEKESKDRRQCLSAFMTKYDVPLQLRREAHALYPALIERHVYDPVRVTDGLPPWFAARLVCVLRVHLLRKISFLKDLEEDILLLVADNLEMRTIDAGTTVVEHATNGTEMFLISRGVCDVFIPKADISMKWVAKLREGQVFGELGLLEACRRTASVRTATACELFILTQLVFDKIASEYPVLREALVSERDARQQVVPGGEVVENILDPPSSRQGQDFSGSYTGDLDKTRSANFDNLGVYIPNESEETE